MIERAVRHPEVTHWFTRPGGEGHTFDLFVGTRVPVRILFEYLSAGDSVDTFLDAFPSVSREQAVAILGLAGDLVTHSARSPR